MARIQFPCEDCGRQLRIDEEEADGEVRCPHCEHVMDVPDEESTEESPADRPDPSAGPGPVLGESESSEPSGTSAGPDRPGEDAERTGRAERDVSAPSGADSAAGESGASNFSVANVITTSFGMFFEDLIKFVSLGLIVLSPMLLVALGLVVSPGEGTFLSGVWQITNGLGGIILTPLLAGALMFGVIRRLNGDDFEISECLSRALSLLFPLIGLSILQGLIIGFGFVLCFIPGLVAATMLYVCIPAMVIEETGVIEALSRSYELTSGNLLRIFGILIILGLMNVVLISMVMAGTAGINLQTASTQQVKMYIVLSSVVSLLMNTIASITIATTYYFLRLDKEDTTLDELVHLFD